MIKNRQKISREQYNIFLKKIGINQWIIKNFTVFFGKFVLNIPKTKKFIIIVNERINFFEKLISDIFILLNISNLNIIFIRLDQLKFIQKPIRIPCWILGDNIDNKNINIVFVTPNLNKLLLNSSFKKRLWSQIYKIYENNIFSCG